MSSTRLKIKSLTAEQAARLPLIRDEWLKIGLDTSPGDEFAAVDAIGRAYAEAKLDPPKIVIWLDSPLAGCYGAAFLAELVKRGREGSGSVVDQVGAQIGAQVVDQVWYQVRSQVWAQVRAQVGAQVRDQVRDQVWDQVGDQVGPQVWAQVGDQVVDQVGAQVGAQVWDQVGAQIGAQVRDQVWNQVGAQVRAQVRDQVGDQVRAQVRAQVRDQVRDQVGAQVGNQVVDQVVDQVRAQVGDQVGDQVGAQVRDQVWAQVWDQVWAQVWAQVRRSCYGSHDANWLGFHAAFQEFGIEQCKRLRPLMDLAQHSGWWWPFRGAVVVTRKPNLLSRDSANRLHSATGPALRYPGGWSIWAWHGLRVPQRLIEQPETITVAEIDGERNTEIRRVLLDRYGVDRYMLDSGAKVVHEDRFGQLLRRELADDEPIVMVKVKNSTPESDGSIKTYMLRVPPTVTTCREGVAWTFDMSSDEYAPLLET